MTKILLTRPIEQAREFSDQLQSRGWAEPDILISPVLKIEPIENAPHPKGDHPVIITSANALRCLGFDPKRRLAYCVGRSTTQMAQAFGFSAKHMGDSASDLTANLLGQPAQRITHLRGEFAAGTVIQNLRDQGWDADEITLYRQRAIPLSESAISALKGGTGVVLPLFSPRTARLVGQVDQEWHKHTAVVISENVADICANLGFTQVHVAKRPDAKSVLDTICELK